MDKTQVLKAWGKILSGGYPSLSIEITRECPLKCPGCYAYEPEHLQGTPLRTLADRKGEDLVAGVLDLVDKYKPLHLSIVGGEPLVRFRELNVLLPMLAGRGIATQVVTSAVREIPAEWDKIDGLELVVSIDGLQPEHDARRKPATYERILLNIRGHRIKVHSTVTSQTAGRQGYYREFVDFWSAREEVWKIWISFFTPQLGANDAEILSPQLREAMIEEFLELGAEYPKLIFDERIARGYREPPRSPDHCIFAATTLNLSADLKTRISPCQFGGTPDCAQCGCFASAGLSAVGNYKLLNLIPLRSLHMASSRIGSVLRRD
ncbi:MAG: radical SAM protein [Pyrinomonadaceae bacterium]